MKQTQYTSILSMLRKAGSRGCTVRDLMAHTNYASSRVHELEESYRARHVYGRSGAYTVGQVSATERIDRTWREVNGRKLRVYVLRRV